MKFDFYSLTIFLVLLICAIEIDALSFFGWFRKKKRKAFERTPQYIKSLPQPDFKNGKEGVEAELALLNLYFGFVDSDRKQDPVFKQFFIEYEKIKKDHEVSPPHFSIKLFTAMSKTEKIDTCKSYLSDPFLQENLIEFDSSLNPDDEIDLVDMRLSYYYHPKDTDLMCLLRCPFRVDYDDFGYLYFTPVQINMNAPKEIYYHAFTEVDFGNREVKVLMRSKLHSQWTMAEAANKIYKIGSTLHRILLK